MNRARFTEDALKDHAAGAKANDLARKHGGSAKQVQVEGQVRRR
jgi:hypothetical protein